MRNIVLINLNATRALIYHMTPFRDMTACATLQWSFYDVFYVVKKHWVSENSRHLTIKVVYTMVACKHHYITNVLKIMLIQSGKTMIMRSGQLAGWEELTINAQCFTFFIICMSSCWDDLWVQGDAGGSISWLGPQRPTIQRMMRVGRFPSRLIQMSWFQCRRDLTAPSCSYPGHSVTMATDIICIRSFNIFEVCLWLQH